MGMDWRHSVSDPCRVLRRHGLGEIPCVSLFRNIWAHGDYQYAVFCQLEVPIGDPNKVAGGLTSRSS